MPNQPWLEPVVVSYPNLGGLDTTSAPAQVPWTHLTIADNVIFGERKSWKKRGGLVQQNASGMTANPVKKMIDYWEAGSTGNPTQDLVAVSGTHFFKDDGDNVWDDASGSISVPLNSIVTHTVVGDKLVCAMDATIPMVYDQASASFQSLASSAASPSSVPDGNLVIEHQGRLIVNEKNDPHRIHVTGVTATGDGDPTLFGIGNGGDTFTIEPDDGDPIGITAFWRHRDLLYISKLTKIYRLEGTSPNNYRPVLEVNGLGCVSHNMVVTTGNDAFFPSLLGFHSLAVVGQMGNLSKEAYLSAPIHSTFQDDINLARIAHGHGVFIPILNGILWAVPARGESVNKMALFYSFTTKSWTKFTNFQCDALMAKYSSTTRKIELYTGGNIGQSFKYFPFTYKDYGTDPISMRLKSGHIYPDKRFHHKFGFEYFNLLLQPKGTHKLDFSYRVDSVKDSNGAIVKNTQTLDQPVSGAYKPLGSGSFLLGSTILGAESFTQPLDIRLHGDGQAFEWEILNNNLDEDLEVSGWALEVESESIARGTT